MKHINTIKTAIFARVPRTAAAANARLPASLPARPAAALQTRLAKTKTNKLYGLKSDDARFIGSVALFKVS